MRILIACEYSGRVREAFRRKGHDAWSCDLRPTEAPSPYHIQGDVLLELNKGWDAMIAFPYCTYNNLAGVRWLYHPEDTKLPIPERRRHPDHPNRLDYFLAGVEFFQALQRAPIPKIALENSKMHGLATSLIGPADQHLQPWMFGEPVSKHLSLWLKGFPPLKTTHTRRDYEYVEPDCHQMSDNRNREKDRSRTYLAVANAMAQQWG